MSNTFQFLSSGYSEHMDITDQSINIGLSDEIFTFDNRPEGDDPVLVAPMYLECPPYLPLNISNPTQTGAVQEGPSSSKHIATPCLCQFTVWSSCVKCTRFIYGSLDYDLPLWFNQTGECRKETTGAKERFAFRTKSEVEILDDGFKWRKYGKKKVKNSPNPRYKINVTKTK